MMSEWPFKYFVVECRTTSAPNWSGCWKNGVANVLSTTNSAFARRAMHLVGLLRGHFEVEEQVLLPVLDRTMTTEQFQREVADR